MADKNKDDGGPAFPCDGMGQRDFGDPGAYAGMTLRDYFAANAMQSILTLAALVILRHREYNGETFGDVIGNKSYEIADAMLKARKK